ncbi:hypothetical protein D9V62_02985 [Buchnera aphidicola (Aphis helianthi)]|uniref:Uncharacterized protein n=1 Tax=Buchnera aphidicola (Aphis helianthi) TaxID=2315802 RepID=A0A4D6XPI6_9GAMM|nr:hypothetical protein [Buchnera aphidicola]QCI17379.1 hypothetical protein D9V62_02985 [Buchnera aphidicola (Aphis helianthi)]
MSSNINLVDKLNPISFEQNEKFKTKIKPFDNNEIISRIEDPINNPRNNKNTHGTKNTTHKSTKITIDFPQNDLDLVELEKLHEKYLNDLQKIEQKIKETGEIGDLDELNPENSVKKKLILNPLIKPRFKLS